jgi:hypothetical protein
VVIPARPVLDPRNIIRIDGQASVSILPPDLRGLGYAPAVDQLMPGDLLLFKPVGSSLVSRNIARAQMQAGFAASHAEWTHAAIVLYDDVMVEAVPWSGVVQKSLYGRISDHVTLVRRNPTLDDRTRYRIALRALGMLNRRYDHGGALLLGWDLLKGLWSEVDLTANRQIVICSQVYADAHGEMADKRLKDCPYRAATTPAHLAATPDLDDIAINWRRIV